MPKNSSRPRGVRCAVKVRVTEGRVYPVYAREVMLREHVVGQGGILIGVKPLYYVSRAEADEMVANGAAYKINRGKALHALLTLPPEPQESITMGPKVVEAAADGAAWAKALIAGWRKNRVVPATA